MQVETTGLFFDGTCEVQTAWCYARECGALTAVTTPEGTQINICGACLEEMADTGAWNIPGTRPLPWSARAGQLPPGTLGCRVPGPVDEEQDALGLAIRVTGDAFDGRCEVQTDACGARPSGAVVTVTTPDGEVTVCRSCLERMVDGGAWHAATPARSVA